MYCFYNTKQKIYCFIFLYVLQVQSLSFPFCSMIQESSAQVQLVGDNQQRSQGGDSEIGIDFLASSGPRGLGCKECCVDTSYGALHHPLYYLLPSQNVLFLKFIFAFSVPSTNPTFLLNEKNAFYKNSISQTMIPAYLSSRNSRNGAVVSTEIL